MCKAAVGADGLETAQAGMAQTSDSEVEIADAAMKVPLKSRNLGRLRGTSGGHVGTWSYEDVFTPVSIPVMT